MAQIIDALLVTLGLDASNFKKGTDDATKARKKLADQSTRTTAEQSAREKKLADEQAKRAKVLDDGAKRMAQGVAKVRNEALALFAVFTAGVGLKDFFSNTINNAAALGQQAANLSMSTEALSAWQQANELAGGSAAGMTAQLKESADAIAQYKLGQGLNGGMQKFLQYGGSDTAFKDGNTYLLARAKIISSMYKADPTKASLMAGQIGISEFDLLKQTPDIIMAQVEAQKKLSSVTGEDAAEALKLKKEMQQLGFRIESVATKIVMKLAPAIEGIIKKIVDWLDDPKTDVSGWVNSTLTGIGKFIAACNSAADAVGGWQNILMALLGIKVVTMVAPLIQLASALGSVGASLGVVGTAGVAALAALVALQAAKAMGLPDVDASQGQKDVKAGNWWAASAHLSATDFLQAAIGDKASNGIGEFIARTMASLGNKAAGEAYRDNSGNDAYLVGPRSIYPQSPIKQRPSSAPVTVGTPSRGMRNNNPGNIEYGKFAKDNGATGTDGRFAKFPTMEAGQAAMQKLLGVYLDTGSNTISKAIERWAPASEKANNTPAYIAGVSKKLGVGPDQVLSKEQVPALVEAMNRFENGAVWDSRKAMSAVNMPTGASASARGQAASNSSTSTSDVKIGTINVHTQATSADGIAKSLGGAIQNNGLVAQSNGGMN